MIADLGCWRVIVDWFVLVLGYGWLCLLDCVVVDVVRFGCYGATCCLVWLVLCCLGLFIVGVGGICCLLRFV